MNRYQILAMTLALSLVMVGNCVAQDDSGEPMLVPTLRPEASSLQPAILPNEAASPPNGATRDSGLPWNKSPEPAFQEPPMPAPTNTEVPDSFTLEGLEQLALECNPTLVQARMAISRSQGDYVQAGLYPNPVASYIGEDMGNDGYQGIHGAGISQEIVTAGKRQLGQAVASHEVQRSQHAWRAQQQRVLNDVRIGYYATLLSQKRVEVNEQLLAIENQVLQSTQELRKASEVSQVDVLQASVEAEQTELSLSEARDRNTAAWRRLAALVGRPEMEPASLAGDVTSSLPVIAWEDALRQLMTQSPELAQARAGVERARCDVALQCAERIPNFEVGTAVKRDTATGFTIADVGIAMPLPIFNRNQGNILRAQASLTAAQSELRRLELELFDRLATSFEQYVNARRRSDKYVKTILPNAKKTLELTQTGYREGEIEYLTLLTAQRTYYDISLEYLANLQEVWAQSMEIEGMLLRGGLDAPPE